MTEHPIRRLSTQLGVMSASPWAFAILGVYTLIWVVFERDTFDLHGVATLMTWAMTLLIQRAEHRDTQGIQAKLDELLRATTEARTELSQIDDEEPEQIEAHRNQARRDS